MPAMMRRGFEIDVGGNVDVGVASMPGGMVGDRLVQRGDIMYECLRGRGAEW